ncbi:protein of unknown function [Nitrospira defluvii]|uniref:Uncharacterized protein n=1 Tax=Nitrospira defluvii TaxID=330214 RepID=D8PG91_9BACT|nr:protein of unknown function [Nitrospira defluvii]
MSPKATTNTRCGTTLNSLAGLQGEALGLQHCQCTVSPASRDLALSTVAPQALLRLLWTASLSGPEEDCAGNVCPRRR